MDSGFTGGSLKIKGLDLKKKKKKAKSKTHESQDPQESKIPEAQIPPEPRQKTAAEIKFQEIQRKRMLAKVEKEGVKSHKEKVQEFNAHLASLTEHNDIPRVGPG